MTTVKWVKKRKHTNSRATASATQTGNKIVLGPLNNAMLWASSVERPDTARHTMHNWMRRRDWKRNKTKKRNANLICSTLTNVMLFPAATAARPTEQLHNSELNRWSPVEQRNARKKTNTKTTEDMNEQIDRQPHTIVMSRRERRWGEEIRSERERLRSCARMKQKIGFSFLEKCDAIEERGEWVWGSAWRETERASVRRQRPALDIYFYGVLVFIQFRFRIFFANLFFLSTKWKREKKN